MRPPGLNFKHILKTIEKCIEILLIDQARFLENMGSCHWTIRRVANGRAFQPRWPCVGRGCHRPWAEAVWLVNQHCGNGWALLTLLWGSPTKPGENGKIGGDTFKTPDYVGSVTSMPKFKKWSPSGTVPANKWSTNTLEWFLVFLLLWPKCLLTCVLHTNFMFMFLIGRHQQVRST